MRRVYTSHGIGTGVSAWTGGRLQRRRQRPFPCDYNLIPPGNLPYSFNFDDGFEGTDLSSKEFYVMMYYPAQ